MEKPKAIQSRVKGESFELYAYRLERHVKALTECVDNLKSEIKGKQAAKLVIPPLQWEDQNECHSVARGVAGLYMVGQIHKNPPKWTAELADGGVRLIPDYCGGIHDSMQEAKEACDEDDQERILHRLKLNP